MKTWTIRFTSCNIKKGVFLEEDEGEAGSRTQVTRKPWKHNGDWKAIECGQKESVEKEYNN